MPHWYNKLKKKVNSKSGETFSLKFDQKEQGIFGEDLVLSLPKFAGKKQRILSTDLFSTYKIGRTKQQISWNLALPRSNLL